MPSVEIILRDADGHQTERISMDYEPSDLDLSLIDYDGSPAQRFIEKGSRYEHPGPRPNAFAIKLEVQANNLTRVIAREPTGAADAEFLRGLGAILIGFDGDRLREAADRFDALEQEIQNRANAQLQIVTDKERLIYWLLRTLEPRSGSEAKELTRSVTLVLGELGYMPGYSRAIAMLELGEPGCPAHPTPSGGDSPLPQFIREAVTDLVSEVVDEVAQGNMIVKLRERLALYEQALGDACTIAISIREIPGTWSEHDRRVAAGRLLDKGRELTAMPNLHRDQSRPKGGS